MKNILLFFIQVFLFIIVTFGQHSVYYSMGEWNVKGIEKEGKPIGIWYCLPKEDYYNPYRYVIINYSKDTIEVIEMSKQSICMGIKSISLGEWECIKSVNCEDTIGRGFYLFPKDKKNYLPFYKESKELDFSNWIKIGKHARYRFNDGNESTPMNVCAKHKFYIDLYENNQLLQRQFYYRNDTLMEVSNYNIDIMEGQYIYYYKNGTIAEEGNYMEVNRISPQIRKNYLNDLEKEEKYIKIILPPFKDYEVGEWGFGEIEDRKEVKDGKWSYYDKEGNLKGYIVYENGKIVKTSLP